MGEYVSLSKVETAMKLNPIVENICVCARSTERATVALVTPDQVGMLVY
jgi:long-subunit acyl-CoA synthetase (AMP-forming)